MSVPPKIPVIPLLCRPIYFGRPMNKQIENLATLPYWAELDASVVKLRPEAKDARAKNNLRYIMFPGRFKLGKAAWYAVSYQEVPGKPYIALHIDIELNTAACYRKQALKQALALQVPADKLHISPKPLFYTRSFHILKTDLMAVTAIINDLLCTHLEPIMETIADELNSLPKKTQPEADDPGLWY